MIILSIIGLILSVVSLVLNWFIKKQYEEIIALYKEGEALNEEPEQLSNLYIKELKETNASLREKIIELSKQQ